MPQATLIFLTLLLALLAGLPSAGAEGRLPERASNDSGKLTDLVSGGVRVRVTRDAKDRVTGFEWGNAGGEFTPAVTHTWARGVGGRIMSAGSSIVPNAEWVGPSFQYFYVPTEPDESFVDRGRRMRTRTGLNREWTYQYDENGQLVSAVHPTLGAFHYGFDAIGRRTDHGGGNLTDSLNRTLVWSHDQSRSLDISAHPDARLWFNGVEVPNFTGQHTAAIPPPPAQAGGWVPWEVLAVLEGAGEGAGNPPANPLAGPDAKAERFGKVWVPPATENFVYDGSGNRESTALWDYGWDAKNQLVRARTKDHQTAFNAYDITFTYDAEGRRVAKHVLEYRNGALVSDKTVTFLWDGWDLLYERHRLASGFTVLERRYVWGPDIADGAAGGAGGLLLIRETRGQTTSDLIPLYDGTGHLVALTNLSQQLLASYAYGPFGERIQATGPLAETNPWRFATKYLDEETGLYYFGHRYYDPLTGQFLSREPLGESESVNLYAYCHNDPVNKVDVLGLSGVEVNSSGIVEWIVRDPDTGVFGFFESEIARYTIGTVERRFEWRGNSGGYVNGNIVTLPDGRTVPLNELMSYARGNHPSSQSVQWRFSSVQPRLIARMVEEVVGGAARSQNAFSEFAAGAYDRGSDTVNGVVGLVARDGLLGTDFTNWRRWREPSGSMQGALRNLYGNSIMTNSGAQVRENRWDWQVNENTGWYHGGGTSFDAAMVVGPLAYSRFAVAANRVPARVFWSGGDEARLAAEAFAKQSGGVTLEMTATGQRLQQITKGMDWADAKPLWEAASADFARGATGTVNVFQNGTRGVSLESVWRGVEYPLLKQQGNGIIYNVTTPLGPVRVP